MVDIRIQYEGDLHCTATHGPSGATLGTDAPADNHGKGASFSPTDLMATALGTCMVTVMGILANERGYPWRDVGVHVKKHMTSVPPRRVARLAVTFSIPKAVAEAIDGQGRADLEQKAKTCPVRLSLLDAIDVPVVFDWEG